MGGAAGAGGEGVEDDCRLLGESAVNPIRRTGLRSDLRHDAAGVQCMGEGRARCGVVKRLVLTAEPTADHRRGRGHAGATVPGGGVAGAEGGADTAC